MFDGLTASLSKAFKGLSADGRLTPENLKEPLRDVRRALLEADVSLPVVRRFIQKVGGWACACLGGPQPWGQGVQR
jgi:signal recognition particle subunit SRP54